MTDAQKDEALALVDRLIRQWVDDAIHSEAAMFDLRDGMAKLGVPKYFGKKAQHSTEAPQREED